MAPLACALVLNIGTLSADWVDAMLLAGRLRTARACRSCSTRSARARRRTGRRRRAGCSGGRDSGVRGNSGEIATLVGRAAEIRGRRGDRRRRRARELALEAAVTLGCVAAVTGPVDHVSDGERAAASRTATRCWATVTGTGCMATAMTGCFLAVRRDDPLAAATEALATFGVAGGAAAEVREGPGTFHAALYDALANLEPAELASGPARDGDMRLHAIVEDLETAQVAIGGGATVVQLRLKGVSTPELDRARQVLPPPCPTTGVSSSSTTTSKRRSPWPRTVSTWAGTTPVPSGRSRPGCSWGSPPRACTRRPPPSAPARRTSAPARSGRRPSKGDADPPIGLGGLAGDLCRGALPVVAIGGVDASNAAECVVAGATGVAVIRAAREGRGGSPPPSMRLADLGELGLLAELERRGLAEGIGDDAARLDGGLVVTQDALVERDPFPPRLDSARPRLQGRGGQPQRPRRLRGDPEACWSRWARRRTPSSTRCSSSTRG